VIVAAQAERPRTIEDLLGRELLARLDRLDVLSRKVFAGRLAGERRSKRRGSGVEFADFRPYAPGDDPRRIDWNVYARLERLTVKLFREDQDLGATIVLDASPSMLAGSPSKLLFAQRLAIALAYIALVNRNRVGLAVVGAPGRPPVQRLAPMRGRTSLRRAAAFILDNVHAPEGAPSLPAPGPAAGLSRAIRAAATRRGGRGVVVVLSDFLVREDLRDALNWLAAGSDFDAWCLMVLAPAEMDPSRERAGGVVGDLRLIDAETAQHAEVTVTPALLKRYRQRLDAHVARLRADCHARGIAFELLTSDVDVPRLVLRHLRARGMLG
jgi:uncharacterized protein (DUF58 family)